MEFDTWEFISDWPLLSDVETMATREWWPVQQLRFTTRFSYSILDLWAEFSDSEFAVSGEIKYRIRLVNTTPEEEVAHRKVAHPRLRARGKPMSEGIFNRTQLTDEWPIDPYSTSGIDLAGILNRLEEAFNRLPSFNNRPATV